MLQYPITSTTTLTLVTSDPSNISDYGVTVGINVTIREELLDFSSCRGDKASLDNI